MVDTGFLQNESLKGGRFGPYAFSQARMIWSNIKIECNGRILFKQVILKNYHFKLWQGQAFVFSTSFQRFFSFLYQSLKTQWLGKKYHQKNQYLTGIIFNLSGTSFVKGRYAPGSCEGMSYQHYLYCVIDQDSKKIINITEYLS